MKTRFQFRVLALLLVLATLAITRFNVQYTTHFRAIQQVSYDEHFYNRLFNASVHSVQLYSVCTTTGGHPRGAPIISYKYKSDLVNEEELTFQDDPNLYQVLSQCPSVDVYLPSGIRGHGYCEDGMAYVKCKY